VKNLTIFEVDSKEGTTEMSEFIPVMKTSELPEAGKTVVEVDDRIVALFHAAGAFWALDDVCTHDGGTLADGELDGYSIACQRHGAKFDIRDGRALTMPATRPTVAHEVKVEGDQVLIRLNEDS
jgi:3-phenylpropionate/trans-cinnamate dioxygenase ferredoxin component